MATRPKKSKTPGEFGVADASYRAAGEEAGIAKLVDDFYHVMDELPEAATIRRLHPKDLTEARDKLSRFLCGWLGGPKRYHEKYGSISIPGVHQRFPIGVEERDAWLLCMVHAIANQPYSEEFSSYLLEQLFVPAERVRETSREPADTA